MSTDRARAITADPQFQDAVLRALRGDLAGLTEMDDEHLRVASRTVSVLIAGRVVESAPCTLAGVAFWAEHGALTFAPADPSGLSELDRTAARMIAVDGTALLHRDHSVATHELWAALLGCVPVTLHRSLTMLIAGKFTTAPEPATHAGPHPAASEDRHE
ncbi:hypothetical protein [Pengzhenrongella sp.]|jgi:hypothetical protein|uniref:hypothetical protein n=1 Tax=Pengzhenrongella sp. TaxID=2888820 RepID=UPI002F942C77